MIATKLKANKYSIVILVLALLLVFNAVAYRMSRSDVQELEQDIAKLNQVLLGGEEKVFGQSCGILSARQAQALLGKKQLTLSTTNQPVANTVLTDDGVNIHWSDTCRYVAQDNDSFYVELHIDTYSDTPSAELGYENELPQIDDTVVEQSQQFDELRFSSGVWYVRGGAKVYKISASNGDPGSSRQFSQTVLDVVAQELF